MRWFRFFSLTIAICSSAAIAQVDEQRVLQKTVDAYSKVSSMKQLVSLVERTLNAEDKAFLKSYMQDHLSAPMPKMGLVQGRLQISQDGQVVDFKFTDIRKGLGSVKSQSVDLSPGLPLAQRLKRLDEILGAKSAAAGRFDFQILPEAHAVLVWVAAGMVLACAAGTAYDYYNEEYLADIHRKLTDSHNKCLELEKKAKAGGAIDAEGDTRSQAISTRLWAISDQLGGYMKSKSLLGVLSYRNLSDKPTTYRNEELAGKAAECFEGLAEKHIQLPMETFKTVKANLVPIKIDGNIIFGRYGTWKEDPFTAQ